MLNLAPDPRDSVDIEEVRSLLSAQMEEVARNLFPGKVERRGQNLRFGNHGSLSVQVEGADRGRWYSFEEDTGGGPFDLVMFALACDFSGALEWATHFLAIDKGDRKTWQARLDAAAARAQATENHGQAADKEQKGIEQARAIWTAANEVGGTVAEAYLKSRGLGATTVARYCPDFLNGGPAILFPMVAVEGCMPVPEEIRAVQGVMLDQEGRKREHPTLGAAKITKGCPRRAAFGIAMSHPETKAKAPIFPVLLCEGPEDALSLAFALKEAKQPHNIFATMGKWNVRHVAAHFSSGERLYLADPDAEDVVGFDTLRVSQKHSDCKDPSDVVQKYGLAQLARLVLEAEAKASARPRRPAFFDPWQEFVPPSLDLECFPPAMRDVIRDQHETIGADIAGIAMAHVAAVAGSIHGLTRVSVRQHTKWEEHPRLWVMLVGDPSTKKTPIISQAITTIELEQNAAFNRYHQAMLKWKNGGKENGDPEPPEPTRYLVNDTTPEKLGEILSKNDRGTLVHRDELSGFIGDMDRYTGGRGGTGNRSFWLQCYNGGGYTVDRVGRGVTYIPNLSANILGGMQPDRLRSMRDLMDDGLLQRFLPVMLGKASMGIDRPWSPAHTAYREHMQKLLGMGPIAVMLDPKAHELKEKAFQRLHDLAGSDTLGRGFQAFCGKQQGLLMRLALTLHCADPDALSYGSDALAAHTMARAIRLQDGFLMRHAAMFYDQIGGGGVSEETRNIAGWLLTQDPARRTYRLRDFTRGPRCCRGDIPTVDLRRKLEMLENGGWLLPASPRDNREWTLAEGIHEHFAERAAHERKFRDEIRSMVRGDAEPEGEE